MSKKEVIPKLVEFKPIVPPGIPSTDSDEIVLRVQDICLMYVKNGSCYLQADIWDTAWQLKVLDYDCIKRTFMSYVEGATHE